MSGFIDTARLNFAGVFPYTLRQAPQPAATDRPSVEKLRIRCPTYFGYGFPRQLPLSGTKTRPHPPCSGGRFVARGGKRAFLGFLGGPRHHCNGTAEQGNSDALRICFEDSMDGQLLLCRSTIRARRSAEARRVSRQGAPVSKPKPVVKSADKPKTIHCKPYQREDASNSNFAPR